MNKSLALYTGFVVLCWGLPLAPIISAEKAAPAPTPAPAATPAAAAAPAPAATAAPAPAAAAAPAPAAAAAPAPAAAAAPAPAAAAEAPNFKTLLSGNTLLYKDGKKMGAEFYGSDGRYASSEGDKGVWSVKDGKVCIADTSENRCWTGVVNGPSIMWYDEDGDYEGTGNLVKGNSSGL
ncbi:hypothetical protein CCP4SC76_150001 [Gammaproteobacteria bacterium]